MKRFFYVLWQWLWGLPQNLVGLVIYLRYVRCPHFHYQGATVTVWPVRSGSMSMGQFLFLHPTWTPDQQSLLAHEYGHTIQSLLLGPLYLLIIGLPSVVWAGLPAFRKLRAQKKVPYSALYTEKWADHNGARYAKKKAPVDI